MNKKTKHISYWWSCLYWQSCCAFTFR